MKKFMLMAALVAVVVAALAIPALAKDHPFKNDKTRSEQRQESRFANFWDNFNAQTGRWQDRNNPNNFENSGIIQTNQQQVESGNSGQSFTGKGGGDNSNACQGIQGVSNTGNAINSTGVIQSGSSGSFVVVDGSGNFEISPSSKTTCAQQVNQSATATSAR